MRIISDFKYPCRPIEKIVLKKKKKNIIKTRKLLFSEVLEFIIDNYYIIL